MNGGSAYFSIAARPCLLKQSGLKERSRCALLFLTLTFWHVSKQFIGLTSKNTAQAVKSRLHAYHIELTTPQPRRQRGRNFHRLL
jgi:hypothetical protein